MRGRHAGSSGELRILHIACKTNSLTIAAPFEHSGSSVERRPR
jgi:hypothetical protein